MATIPTLTSPRGQVTKYFFSDPLFGEAHTTNLPSHGYNLPQTAHSEDDDVADVSSAVPSSTVVTNVNADDQKILDVDAGVGYHPVNLSYNPVTDEFKICEGEAVL